MRKFLYSALFFLLSIFLTSSSAYAIVDPLAVPNNRFGIHIIQATPDESSPAASLVNSSGGDWGYITVLVESKDRDHDKWQEFFNDLRRRHLIPLVRLATQPQGNIWVRPYEGEEQAWADFLDRLNWPTKNRYVIIYNEPNHAKEWGGAVDAKLYAETLDKTITALKSKNRDFFVLNAGFDASAPHKPPLLEEEVSFMEQMEQAVPGIFNKLDGWVSHSYPNPGFIGSPNGVGRGTVRTYIWELQLLRGMGVSKNLPVFIAETGWRHAEGLTFDLSLPTAETVAAYYKSGFEGAWNANFIVAVTPSLLSYQESPFDHFSFKKTTGQSDYYPQYETLLNMSKTPGKPIQESKAELTRGEIFSKIVSGEIYNISLTFKNTGQSIWQQVKLVPIQGGQELGIEGVELSKDIKTEPGQEHTFNLKIKAPTKGIFNIILNLFTAERDQFESAPFEFTTEVKQPVILKVKSNLKWKKVSEGEYMLTVVGAIGETEQKVYIGSLGESDEIEARYLLPDYAFDFTLTKPFYKPSGIRQTVHAGVNILDFGSLQPDIISALLHPKELWKLLPFSN